MNDVKNPTRRGFLGLLAGALALPAVAPIITPKRSFFSFFLPKGDIEVVQEFDLQREIDKLSKAGGGVVRIPEGIYAIGKSIVLPDDVSFKMENGSALMGCNILCEGKEAANPRGIFVTEPEEKEEKSLVTGCFFDMKNTKRAVYEIFV